MLVNIPWSIWAIVIKQQKSILGLNCSSVPVIIGYIWIYCHSFREGIFQLMGVITMVILYDLLIIDTSGKRLQVAIENGLR